MRLQESFWLGTLLTYGVIVIVLLIICRVLYEVIYRATKKAFREALEEHEKNCKEKE